MSKFYMVSETDLAMIALLVVFICIAICMFMYERLMSDSPYTSTIDLESGINEFSLINKSQKQIKVSIKLDRDGLCESIVDQYLSSSNHNDFQIKGNDYILIVEGNNIYSHITCRGGKNYKLRIISSSSKCIVETRLISH